MKIMSRDLLKLALYNENNEQGFANKGEIKMFEGYININGQELPLESSFKSFNDYFGYKDYIKRSIQYSSNKLIYELSYDE